MIVAIILIFYPCSRVIKFEEEVVSEKPQTLEN